VNRKQRHKPRSSPKPRSPIQSALPIEQSESLFHYTTATGLIGIVRDRVLWSTHANYLNDTAELKILTELLTPQISLEFRDAVPKLLAVGALLPELLKSFGESIYDSEARNVCRSVIRTIEQIAPLYVTSFCMHRVGSEEHEHGLLSQWRGYGRGGFAIEFDERELDKLTILENEQRSLQMIATRQVAYKNHGEVANLERFAGVGLAALGAAFREKNPNLAARPEVAEIFGSKELVNFIAAFMETLPFLKTARFQEENEYRLVTSATRPGQTGGDIRAATPVYFREGAAGAIVPYIKLFETLGAHLPIKKLIVGPHRDQENQYNAARLLLDQQGIDVPVLRSDTTLRF
jgi:Protein of unknown function (DUF2971)